jgi:hypothetical protein
MRELIKMSGIAVDGHSLYGSLGGLQTIAATKIKKIEAVNRIRFPIFTIPPNESRFYLIEQYRGYQLNRGIA